jgi:hypothetical protein
MRDATFSVPEAMEHLYEHLREAGFQPEISSAPSEWRQGAHADTSAYIRITHVAGIVDINLSPLGRSSEVARQRGWRHPRYDCTEQEFVSWLDTVWGEIRSVLGLRK